MPLNHHVDDLLARTANVNTPFTARARYYSSQVFQDYCDEELPAKKLVDLAGELTMTKERRVEDSEKKFEKIIAKMDLTPCQTQLRIASSTSLWRLNSQQIERNA